MASICMAKGMDDIALKIREIAGEHNCPDRQRTAAGGARCFRWWTWTRSILREHYEAVAKVIGFRRASAKALFDAASARRMGSAPL